jgi:hypothetical protein
MTKQCKVNNALPEGEGKNKEMLLTCHLLKTSHNLPCHPELVSGSDPDKNIQLP